MIEQKVLINKQLCKMLLNSLKKTHTKPPKLSCDQFVNLINVNLNKVEWMMHLKFNIVIITFLSKLICGFNTIPIKIAMQFEVVGKTLHFNWENNHEIKEEALDKYG